MIAYNASNIWGGVSTAGTLYDLCSQIGQGDDYDQRFGSHIEVTHVNVKINFTGGSAATKPADVRCTLFLGDSNTAFNYNMTGTFSPVSDANPTRLLWDKFYQVNPSGAGLSLFTPVLIDKSFKLRHRQKFNGTAAGSTTANCLFLQIHSNVAAGTLNPVISTGVVEVFFKP